VDNVSTHNAEAIEMNTPTVTQDGHDWIQRAGKLWGTYQTFASYLGRKSANSVACFASRHNLKRIKHGKQVLLSKDQVDSKTGATLPTK
jgi:hypothetical protein